MVRPSAPIFFKLFHTRWNCENLKFCVSKSTASNFESFKNSTFFNLKQLQNDFLPIFVAVDGIVMHLIDDSKKAEHSIVSNCEIDAKMTVSIENQP